MSFIKSTNVSYHFSWTCIRYNWYIAIYIICYLRYITSNSIFYINYNLYIIIPSLTRYCWQMASTTSSSLQNIFSSSKCYFIDFLWVLLFLSFYIMKSILFFYWPFHGPSSCSLAFSFNYFLNNKIFFCNFFIYMYILWSLKKVLNCSNFFQIDVTLSSQFLVSAIFPTTFFLALSAVLLRLIFHSICFSLLFHST